MSRAKTCELNKRERNVYPCLNNVVPLSPLFVGVGFIIVRQLNHNG